MFAFAPNVADRRIRANARFVKASSVRVAGGGVAHTIGLVWRGASAFGLQRQEVVHAVIAKRRHAIDRVRMIVSPF